MNILTQKKKAKRLFSLWIISYIVFSIISRLYISYQQVIVGYNPVAMLTEYQIFALGIMIVYFIPLLVVAYYRFKAAEMKTMQSLTYVLLWLICIWTVVMLFLTILTIIHPDMTIFIL